MSKQIKLKSLLKEGYAWERKPGKPLPTIQEVMDEYESKQEKETPIQEMDAEGYSRMDGLVSQKDINSLVNAASNIIRDLKADGFDSEDIFDFIIDHIKTLDEGALAEGKDDYMDAVYIHQITGSGQDAAQNFIDDYNLDSKKLAAYVKMYRNSKEIYDVRDYIAGTGVGAQKNLRDRFIKNFKRKK
jgi:hypothetical protein